MKINHGVEMKKQRIKLIALILLSMVILSFVGCAQNENDTNRDSYINAKTSAPNCKINGREFVSDDEDDYATKGAKMAEALVTSEQEFILP